MQCTGLYTFPFFFTFVMRSLTTFSSPLMDFLSSSHLHPPHPPPPHTAAVAMQRIWCCWCHPIASDCIIQLVPEAAAEHLSNSSTITTTDRWLDHTVCARHDPVSTSQRTVWNRQTLRRPNPFFFPLQTQSSKVRGDWQGVRERNEADSPNLWFSSCRIVGWKQGVVKAVHTVPPKRGMHDLLLSSLFEILFKIQSFIFFLEEQNVFVQTVNMYWAANRN